MTRCSGHIVAIDGGIATVRGEARSACASCGGRKACVTPVFVSQPSGEAS